MTYLFIFLLVAYLTMSWWMPANWYRSLLYPGGKPNALARRLNQFSEWISSIGVAPSWMVSLETRGRKSGKKSRVPLVMVQVEGKRYLVSMLGQSAHWVLNVRASEGQAILRHGVVETVQLVEVATAERAPILREYLRKAPGARPHMEIGMNASISEFDAIAGRYPVFLICSKDHPDPEFSRQ